MNTLHRLQRGILLLGFLFLILTASRAQNFSVYSYAFSTEPKIDGYIDKGWDDNDFLQISHNLTSEEPVAQEDFSGSFKISWYGNDLYFLFMVTDDVLIRNEDQPIWLGDNINLYLDLGNEKDITYDNNDYLCHFKWGNSDYYERYNGNDLVQIENSEIAIEFAQNCDTVKHLFIMEIAIRNLAELNGPAKLNESTAIGMDAGIYDCDEGNPCFFTHHLSWVDTTGLAWSDPSKLGTAGFGTAMLKAAKTPDRVDTEGEINAIMIFPTVTSQMLTIQTASTEILIIEIFDLIGTRVHSGLITSDNSVIDVSMLGKGMYLVSVFNSKGLLGTRKIIITE